MSRPAKLPALSPVNTGNPALDTLLRQIIERMDVREGSRGDPMEKVVTHREMKALGLDAAQIGAAGLSSNVVGGSRGGVMVQTPGGSFTRVPYDTFADELRKTALYRDLMQSINSVNRFDGVPQEVRAILLSSLADEAAQWGAEIRRLDKKIQSETESLAYTVETITAAVSGAASGVREVSFANATANAATAGRITQVTARLDDFSDGTPGTATIEQKMTATASKTTGLGAQYTLKVGTGGKYAGIGLASETSTAGVSTSAIIFSTDKFALVGPNEVIADPANPPVNRLPFGYDSATNTLFINGQVRINAGGPTINDGIQGPAGDPGAPGAPGSPGLAGARGSLTGYGENYGIYSASWPDLGDGATAAGNLANRVINNMLTGETLTTALASTTHLRIGDTITLTNAATATTAATKYWGGSGWLLPGVVIDGNLLVSGTVSADKISAGTINANLIIKSSGYIWADGTSWTAGSIAAGHFNSSGTAFIGVQGNAGASGTGVQGTSHTAGSYGVVGVGTTLASKAIRAIHQIAGGTALDVVGNTTMAGNLTVTGTISPANFNAATLDGYDSMDFARYTGVASLGNPGTAFTHSLTFIVGTTTFRIPVFIG